jgi:hypothetical protein
MGTWIERQSGLLLVIVAVIWAVYHVVSIHEFNAAYLRLGPMQLLLAGTMLWLHGKFRAVRYTHARRDYQTRFREF